MELGWLRVFREVAARGSLTAAAQALGYTQPAVSRQICALENATGGRLFDRLPRGVRLTEEGRCLLGHAEAVLARLSAAGQDLADLRELAAGRLRVGAFDSADAALVPRALATFRAAHPHVVLSVSEGNSTAQIGRLINAEIDLAVISAYPQHTLRSGQLDLHRLADDPLLVAMPSGHRLAGRAIVRLAELTEETWIEGHPDGAQALTGACQRAGFQPRIEFGIREWPAKQGFVAAGLGLALVPLLAATATPPGVALARLHHCDGPVRTIYAATWRAAAMPAAAAAFVPHLAAAARELQATTEPRAGQAADATTGGPKQTQLT